MKLNRITKILANASAVGMFLVLIAGVIVTNTDSGRGCGGFPLCHGKFIPAYTLESMIEYSHRAVSAIVGLLVVATLIAVYRSMKTRKDAKLFAMTAFLFTVIQALLGALAVTWEQSSLVLALHFGISLIAFAATLLLAITVQRMDKPQAADGWGEAIPADVKVSAKFWAWVWSGLVYCYIVVYIGAFVRHTDAVAGCKGWPLCNGELIPDLQQRLIFVAFGHRIAALLLMILLLWVGYIGYRTYRHFAPIRQSAKWIMILIVAQVLSGAIVAVTLESEDVFLFSSMLHATIIALLFGVICYLSLLVWRLGGKRNDA